MKELIYLNKRKPTLYFASFITFALSVFVFYMIFRDFDKFLSEFRSDFSASFWILFLIIMGNVMFACMIWLSGRYVLRIEIGNENEIFIKTWSIMGLHKTLKYPSNILKDTTYYNGVSRFPGVPIVVSPFSIIKSNTGEILILDEYGTWLKKHVFKKAKRNWEQRE